MTAGAFNNNSGNAMTWGLFNSQPVVGNEAASELTYGGYARVGGNAFNTGWTIAQGAPPTAKNAQSITFPTCTSNDNQTATHWGMMMQASSGSTPKLMFSGPLDAPLVVSNGYTPVFGVGSIVYSGTN